MQRERVVDRECVYLYGHGGRGRAGRGGHGGRRAQVATHHTQHKKGRVSVAARLGVSRGGRGKSPGGEGGEGLQGAAERPAAAGVRTLVVEVQEVLLIDIDTYRHIRGREARRAGGIYTRRRRKVEGAGH